MNSFQRAWVAGLLGMGMAVCWSQDATEENAADAQVQREAETQVPQEADVLVRQESEVEGSSPAVGATAAPDAAVQAEATADADVTDARQTGAGGADGAAPFPEIATLDELFIPSLGLAADEAWDRMPVDF